MNHNIPLVDLHVQYQAIRDQIREAWDSALDRMNLFLGPNVEAFEEEFAAYCGVKEGIGVSDGTNALILALRAIGIRLGDEVITVSHTFFATAEAILLAGGRPVFVDIDPLTMTMDANQVEDAITPRTRAILPVHLYGQTADMAPILQIARTHNLFVIEDACQAHGAEYQGQRAGSLGTMAAFSFYLSKNLGAYGEGGMVTTNDPELAKKVRLLRNHGSEQRYYHEQVGINGRLDELQAAVLRIKLAHLDEWNDRRRAHAGFLNDALSGCDLTLPFEKDGNRHVYHLYVIRSKQREALRQYLNERGVGTGIHYPVPSHLQVACKNLGYGPGSLPVTESIAGEILSLPMYPELNPEQLTRVVEEVSAFHTAVVKA